jgi:hypothetical protein
MEDILNKLIHNKVNNEIVPNKFEQSETYTYGPPLRQLQSHKKSLLSEINRHSPTRQSSGRSSVSHTPKTSSTPMDSLFRNLDVNNNGTQLKQHVIDLCKTKKTAIESDIQSQCMSAVLLKALVHVTSTNIVWCDLDNKTVHTGTKTLKEGIPCHIITTVDGTIALQANTASNVMVKYITSLGWAPRSCYEAMPAAWLKPFGCKEKRQKKAEVITHIIQQQCP